MQNNRARWYDAGLGRFLSEDPSGLGNGDQTRYRYDAEGNLRAVIDAEQNVTTYTYDGLDRQTEDKNAFGTRTTQYDAAGRVLRIYDRLGRVRVFNTYDTLDRPTLERWLDNSPTTNEVRKITREYDKLGRITKEVDGYWNGGSLLDDIVNTYQYDGLGRLVQQANYDPLATPGASGRPEVLQTYSFFFQTSSLGPPFQERVRRTEYQRTAGGTIPLGFTQFEYNRLGQLSAYDDRDQGTGVGPMIESKNVRFVYDTAGNLSWLSRRGNFDGNVWNSELVGSFTYDKSSRLTSLTHDLATDIVHTYGYDNASRVTSFNTTGSGEATRDYTYDQAGQLTGQIGGFDGAFFEYDDNGNRVLRGSYNYTSPIHTIDPANRLTNDGGYSYSYDNEGNLTRRTPLTDVSATNPVVVYGYDHRNRLVTVVKYASVADANANNGGGQNAIQSIGYAYDASGRRVRRTLDANGAAAGGVANESFVYDGDELALRFGNAGELTHRYLYGPAVDQVLADEVFTAGSGGQRVSDEVLWQLADQQGSVRDIVDDTATIRKHVDYRPFGQVLNPQAYGQAVEQLFHFQGREWDEEAGLQNNRARWYDPNIGRFLSEDPSGVRKGNDPNAYRYVGNSPTNYTDPTGLYQAGNPLLNLVNSGFQLSKPAAPLPSLQTSVSTDYLRQSILGPSPFLNAGLPTASLAASVSPTSTFAGLGLSTLGVPTADQSLRQALAVPFPVSSLLPGQLREPRHVTSVEVLEGIHAGDVVRNTYNTLAAQHQQVANTTNSPLSAFGNQYAASLFRTFGRVEGAITDTFLPASDPNVRIHYSDGTSLTVLGGGPTTGALAGQALAITQPILGNVSRPAGQLVLRTESSVGANAPSVIGQRTNAQLVQDIAARAEAKIGGTGAVAGTAKHIYARDLLRRYQDIFGNRGLQAEVSVIGRKEFPYGTAGSVRLDVLEGPVANPTSIYDYKFGTSVLSPSRINQIQTVTDYGRDFPIILVRP